MVSIDAFQALDPGSIPGQRSWLLIQLLFLLPNKMIKMISHNLFNINFYAVENIRTSFL